MPAAEKPSDDGTVQGVSMAGVQDPKELTLRGASRTEPVLSIKSGGQSQVARGLILSVTASECSAGNGRQRHSNKRKA